MRRSTACLSRSCRPARRASRRSSPATVESSAGGSDAAPSHTEHSIVNALRAAGKLALSLVAEADGVVIGHVAISPVSLSDGTSGWFGVGPISVLPQYQRRGVGSPLMREALRLLRDRAAGGCVVLGEPAYYGRFGFKADPNLVLPGVPAEYFQAMAFGAAKPRGSVTYHEAFNAEA